MWADDMDQSLEFIGVVVLMFLLPFALSWYDENIDRATLPSAVRQTVRDLATRLQRLRDR